MNVKEESEKVGLKLNIQETKIIASSPITSWQIDGETVETVTDFILGGSKITADGDCSHGIKSHLLLGRKVMTNLDSIFKSRDIILPETLLDPFLNSHYLCTYEIIVSMNNDSFLPFILIFTPFIFLPGLPYYYEFQYNVV